MVKNESPYGNRIECYRVINKNVFLSNKKKVNSKGSQNDTKFVNGESNSLRHKSKSIKTNTSKDIHLPECPLNPTLCKCVNLKLKDDEIIPEYKVVQKVDKVRSKNRVLHIPKQKRHKHESKPSKRLDSKKGRKVTNKKKNKTSDDGEIVDYRIAKTSTSLAKIPLKSDKQNNKNKVGDVGDQSKKISNKLLDTKKQITTSKKQPDLKKPFKTGNVGHGDQITTINKNEKTDKCKCPFSVLSKAFRSLGLSKKKQVKEIVTVETNEPPLFEIKVDSSDMRVINTAEIRDKVQALGKIKQDDFCICPSRKKYISSGICKSGVCEAAFKKNKESFNCKCAKHKIECSDSTCNKFASSVAKGQPYFEVTLDSKDMNIINSEEINEIFKRASKRGVCPDGVCPDGVCREATRAKNVKLNCNCMKRKFIPRISECDNKTCSRKSHELHKDFRTNLDVDVDGWDEEKWTKILKHQQQKASSQRDHVIRKGVEKKKKRRKNSTCSFTSCARSLRNISTCQRKPKKRFQILRQCRMSGEECEKELKKQQKLYYKEEKRAEKDNLKLIKMIEKQRKKEAGQWNCLSNLVVGLMNLTVQGIKKIFTTIFTLITNPIGSYVYVRQKIKHPTKTVKRIIQWFKKTWGLRSSYLSNAIKDSEAMSVISDHIENMAVYDTLFANKGKTKEEREIYERKKRMRERRMRKRHDDALYGCRHMMLTTMRKTPCLWCYYLCPNMYPQCLSMMAFLKNFLHIIIYLAALACWTPCIITFEMCRAFLCCMFCTN